MSGGGTDKIIGIVKKETYKGIKIAIMKHQKYPLCNKEYFHYGSAYLQYFDVVEKYKFEYGFPISIQFQVKEKIASLAIKKLKRLIDRYLFKNEYKIRFFEDIVNMKKDNELTLKVKTPKGEKIILLKVQK